MLPDPFPSIPPPYELWFLPVPLQDGQFFVMNINLSLTRCRGVLHQPKLLNGKTVCLDLSDFISEFIASNMDLFISRPFFMSKNNRRRWFPPYLEAYCRGISVYRGPSLSSMLLILWSLSVGIYRFQSRQKASVCRWSHILPAGGWPLSKQAVWVGAFSIPKLCK